MIRTLEAGDWAEWLRMRCALWPHHTPAEHEAEMAAWQARPDAGVIVAVRAARGLCGFAEVATRPYAPGCETSPAYLEGWYVDMDVRRRGVGRALVAAVEAWARGRGFHELTSDALLDNVVSHRAHRQLGFTEVERAVHYRRPLAAPSG